MKYLGINQEDPRLMEEENKVTYYLIKDTDDNLNRWRDSPCC